MKIADDRGKEPIPIRWLKPREAAIYARVTVGKIRQWIADGTIPVAMTRNKQDIHSRGACGYILDRNDIDRLLEQLKIRVSDGRYASDRTGSQCRMGRGVSKLAPPPALNDPSVKPDHGKKHRPGEPD